LLLDFYEHDIYDAFINQDLFVSPFPSNLNDGLSPASPFQTIAWAWDFDLDGNIDSYEQNQLNQCQQILFLF